MKVLVAEKISDTLFIDIRSHTAYAYAYRIVFMMQTTYL